MFKGFPVEAIEFYEGLEADNSKTYWQEHKAIYDACVKAPMEALLVELAPRWGAGKIFRPNRDVRFSADKSPYKTAMAATLGGGGYIQLSSAGLGVGSGMYMMAADQLERYRAAVADDGTGVALTKLIASTSKTGIEITAHESLKTAPRGYPKDHPRIDLLRQKGLICWQQWDAGAWLGTAKAKQRVEKFLTDSRPICEWLDKHVGESTIEGGWGR